MQRQWVSRVALVLAAALIAGGVIAAARADTPPATQVDNNDGGAWQVNSQHGSVGHVNRSVMEVTTAVVVAKPKSAITVSQAQGVVAAHDQTLNKIVLVDDRLNMVANQSAVPNEAEMRAIPGGVAVVDGDGGRSWVMGRVRLSEVDGIEDDEPTVSVESPIGMTVDLDGAVHVLEPATLRLWTLTLNGSVSQAAETNVLTAAGLDAIEGMPSLTNHGTDLVILDEIGLNLYVISDGVVTTYAVGEEWGTAVLQQPSERTGRIVAVAADGAVMAMSLEDGVISELGRIDGTDVLRPIDHDGTVYVVSANPPILYGFREGAEPNIRPLSGQGRDLRLRLVNGWIWVNEATTGTVWSIRPDGELDRVDDWGIAVGNRTINAKEASVESEDFLDENTEYVEEPDNANAEIVSADRQTDEDGINEPPIAHPDRAATRPDRPVSIDVIANDEDPDGDVLLVTHVDGADPGQGRAEPTADRSAVQFTPSAGFTGSVEFVYGIDDGRGGSAVSEVLVDVIPLDQNEPPVAATDVAATRAGSPVRINVLTNDTDPEGDPLVLLDVIAPKGFVSFTPDGQVVFFPAPDDNEARIELVYTIADSYGETAEGILRVAVRPVESNNEPDARNDTAVGVIGTPLTFNVLDNDYDADGDVLTVIRPPEDPRIRLTTDGELFFLPDRAEVVKFTYVISDGSESDTAQVRIDVQEPTQNRPPVAIRDDAAIPRGGSGTVHPLENDADPDGDILNIADWLAPEGLSAEVVEGSSFRLTSALNVPSSMSLRYAISDGTNDPVWSTIVVTIVDQPTSNQAPIPLDDYVEVRGGVPTLVDVLANDTDPDGDGLSLAGVSGPPDARLEAVGNMVRIDIDADRRGGFAFSYNVVDDVGNLSSATVTVRVVSPTEPNRAPVARTDIVRTPEDKWIVVDVIGNDSDPDGDAIVVLFSSQPRNGTVQQIDHRTLLYSPDPGFSGTDSFEYVIEDVHGDQARGEVIIGVMRQSEVNRPPVANDDRVVIASGRTNLVIPVLANDTDPDGDPLVVTRVTKPNAGTVSMDDDARLVVFDSPPDAVEGDEVTFVYDVQDGRGGSATAVVSVLIRAESEPAAPVAVDDLVGPVAPGTPVEIPVLANDLDPDGNAAALSVSSEDPAVRVKPNRMVEITASTETTRHWYTVTDVDGLTSTGIIVVFVVDNQPPIIGQTEVETLVDQAVEIDLTATASDPDGDPLLFICCDNIRNGSVDLLSETESELRVNFTPNSGFVGRGGFAFRVDDRQGHVVTSTVSVNVKPPANTPPTAETASIDVEAGGTAVIDLSLFGSDADGDPLSLASLGSPRSGVVSVEQRGNTAVVSAPLDKTNSSDELSFALTDGEDQAEGLLRATVVQTSKEPPVARDDIEGHTTNQGEPITIDVLANDIDPLGEGLTVVSASVAPSGSVSVGSDARSVTFQPNPDFFGTATFTYTIQDVTRTVERESTAQVQVNVIGRPATPQRPAVEGGNAQVVVTWLAPEGNGAPIEEYEMRSSDGTSLSVGLTTGYTISGLTNGQAYTFDVRARNVAGWGEWSEASTEVTPDTLPDVPAAPSLTFGDEQISIAWTAPYNEGSAITSYLLQSSDGVRIDVGNITDYTWTGLTNGTAYTFQVAAVNAAGNTVFGPASAPETPAREPDAPNAPSSTRGSTLVDLSWSEPALNGAPILEYEVRMSPSGTTTSVGASTSYTWASLPNGVSVTFQIRGRNKAGWSPWSAASVPVTPCGAPDPIGAPGAVRGDQQATVSWSSPNPQGCRIDQYEVLGSGAGSQFVSGETDITSIGVPRTYDFTGLTNGTSYTFQVRAHNEVGWSASSPSSPAVTPAGPPLVPTLTATPTGVGQVTLSWSTPGDNGSPITGYEVAVNGGSVRAVGSSPYNWTGLSNSTGYSFTVRAINAIGPGAWSAARSATTWGPPNQVAQPSVSAGDRSLTASWNAPATNGSPITRYQVEIVGGASVTTTSRTRTFTGLTNGTTYNIRVRAENAVGWGPWSATRSGTPVSPRRVTVSKGAAGPLTPNGNPTNYVLVSVSGFSPNTSYAVDWFSSRWPTTDWCAPNYQTMTTNSSGAASSSNGASCYYGFWGDDVWVVVGGTSSSHVGW